MTKQKIIIDTDPGHDDAMALMLAVKSNLFDVLAITTVCGNSSIENTTRNARYIMNLLEKEDVPVYSGAEKPLQRELVKAFVHGGSGLDGIDPTIDINLTNNAVEKIIGLVENNEDITLITLGPLTNIAKAIQTNPDVMSKLKEIVMMAGAVKVPGNMNRVAEFNVFVDPDAAAIVFDFPVKKTIVPLDACNNVHMHLSHFEQIQNQKLKEPLLKMVKPYIENIFIDQGIKAALMYDPLTIFYLIKPQSCIVNKYNIKVETNSELTRGMTAADLRLKPEAEPNINVVENITGDDFIKYFIETLSS